MTYAAETLDLETGVQGMALLAMLATSGLTAVTDPPLANNDQPKPLPKAVVEAWKEAGTRFGWMPVDRVRYPLTEEKGEAENQRGQARENQRGQARLI